MFARLLDEGRTAFAGREYQRSAAVLREALGLWRGAALSDFAYDAFAAGEIARLQELRLEALEARIDADLALGRHAALIAELEALTAEHPLREHLRGAYMLALYRCGRQSHALAVYGDTRRVLVEELRIEPSPPLRELQTAILRQDVELDAPLEKRARRTATWAQGDGGDRRRLPSAAPRVLGRWPRRSRFSPAAVARCSPSRIRSR